MSTRTLRQTLEGMTLAFDASAVPNLVATIQFVVTGEEPGTYHLRIADNQATFHLGAAESPTLTIATPSETWLRISEGEILGREAFENGLCKAQGDLSLLMQMDRLFKPRHLVSFLANHQRPPGPIPLGGMHWLGVALLPWAIHWLMVGRPWAGLLLSVGLPLVLSVLLVAYRVTYDRPTWLELGGLGFFAVAAAFTLSGHSWLVRASTLPSTAVMGALWLMTIEYGSPLTARYSKWKYVPALWTNSTFIYVNVVLTLLWGWVFVWYSILDLAAAWQPHLHGWLTLGRHLLTWSAFAATIVLPRRGDRIRIANFERDTAHFRNLARLGLLVALVLLFMFGAAVGPEVKISGAL